MKRKHLSLFAIILVALLMLASCDFVKFTYYETENETLKTHRETLLARLYSDFNADYYADENKIQFEILFQDAINELNECESVEALDTAFETHCKRIEAIPRSLAAMIETISENIGSYASPDDYREAERLTLTSLVTLYREKLLGCQSTDEAESIFRTFKIEVYALKTALAYYQEELDKMKADYTDSLSCYLDYADYRENEQSEITAAVGRFKEECQTVNEKESLTSLYHTYENVLLSIPTAKALYATEQAALANELLITAKQAISLYNLTPTLDDDTLKNTLINAESKEAARYCLAEYLISLAENNVNALPLVKEMAKTALENAYVEKDYRENEQADMKTLVEAAVKKVNDEKTAKNIVAILAETKATLLAFKTNDVLWQEEDEAFSEALSARYQNDVLTPPESLTAASSYRELAAIIDYYAFYQLDYESFLRPTFRVKIGYPHKDAQYEINEVYWYCELIRSAVGITGYFEEDGNHLVITLKPYALATVTNVSSMKPVDRNESLVLLNPDKTYVKRSEDFNDFAYRQNEKTLSGIWNTQQLWYALESGYLPICVPDSPAAKTLARAEDILREIVSDSMTVEEKAFAIFSWFSQNVTYDLQYLPFLYPEDREHYPDSLAATLASFHAEGALFDNYAVCCGFAKAYLIMLRIEGIEAYRLLLHRYTDNAIDNLGNEGYGSHAIVAIRGSDGLFYYSDVEQCYVYNNNKCPKFHQFLQIRKHQTPYENAYILYYNDLPYAEKLPDTMLEDLTYQGYSIHITDRETLSVILDAFAEEPGKVCLSLFSSDSTPFSLEEIIKEDGRFQYNTYCYNGFNEYILYVR